MAVRGLGCPERFTLTAGQKGDAPQAAELIEGLPAEVVMADTAYDADHLRQSIAAKGALAVIPNNPSRALKYPLDKHLYAQRRPKPRGRSRCVDTYRIHKTMAARVTMAR